MKLKRREIRKFIMGCVLVAPFSYMVYDDVSGNSKLKNDDVSVVCVSSLIPTGTLIKDVSMFTTVEISLENYNTLSGIVTDTSTLIGKRTKVNIVPNTVIGSDYFVDDLLYLDNEQKVFNLPSSWIASVPQSIRRGDTVTLYAVRDSVGSYDGAQTLPIGDPILETVCIYIKDSTNREVVDTDQSVKDGRYDASSTVDGVEIKVTQDQIEKLTKYNLNGYKFIIAYE